MSTDTKAVFGQGSSTSWLTDVTCSGNENSLTECMDLTYGTNMCSHGTDVGVRCTCKSKIIFCLKINGRCGREIWKSLHSLMMMI